MDYFRRLLATIQSVRHGWVNVGRQPRRDGHRRVGHQPALSQGLEPRVLLTAAATGSEFQVNTDTSRNPSPPVVAMDADGGHIVTWERYRQDAALSDDVCAHGAENNAPTTDLQLIEQAAAEIASMQLRNTGDSRLDGGFNVTTSYALRLQPYFASYGMLGMLEADRATGTNTYRTAVGEWLEWCGRSTGLSRSILDSFDTGLPDRLLYVEVGGYVGLVNVVKGDAVDSAAANYLLVLEAYRAAGGTVSSSMNEVAEEALATLADLRDDDGLVFGLRDLPAKYLQDNIEVAQGLIAAQDYFRARGDLTRTELSRTMASNLWAALPKFRDSVNNRFYIALGANDEIYSATDTVGSYGLGALEMIASYFPLTDRQALWDTVMARYVPETTNSGVGVERFASAAVELSDPSVAVGQLNQLRGEMPGWYGRSLNDEVYIFRFGLSILALRDATAELPDIKNAAPSVALQNTATLLAENTSTTTAIRVAGIVLTDDALGTNTISLSGADAASFEIVESDLRLKAGVALDFETKTSFAVTVSVDDSAIGSSPDAFANFMLTITDANDTPILGGAAADVAVNDTATISPFTMFTVSDPDTQAMSASVTILNGIFRGDFTPATTNGWTRTVQGNDIRYARTYPSAANNATTIQTTIRAFVFQPRTNAIKPNSTEGTAFRVTVSDGIASSVSNSDTTVITTSVNDAPTIGGASSTVTVNDSATVNPLATTTVSDHDTQEMLISVTILNGVVRGDFTNAMAGNGWNVRQVLGNNITYKRYFSPQANVGAAAQAAFRALVFQPRQNATNPGISELTDFQVTVSDGVAPAVANTGTRVTTTSVNDAPVIGVAVANQTMNDNQTLAAFNTLTVTDPDTQNIFARVTITNGVNRGNFTVASAMGWTRIVVGNNILYERFFSAASNNGTNVQAAVRALVFQPRSNAIKPNTTEVTGFTVFVNDGIANTITTMPTVITTSINDAPVIGGASNAVTVNDNATVNPFSSLLVADADTQETLISVTILNGVARGDFTNANVGTGWTVRQVLGNNITYKRYFSPQANVGASVQAVLRALVFQPRSNAVTPGTSELTDILVTVSDGVAPAIADQNTRVATASVNDAPAVGGAVAGQTMNNNTTKAVFSTLTVSDPDTQSLFARVTITNGVNRGDFTAGSATGWTRTTSGNDIKYERFFSAATNNGVTVEAAIRALLFQPRHNVPVGIQETTTFTVFVNDGLANVTNSTTSVSTTGVAARVADSFGAMLPTFLNDDVTTVILPTVSKRVFNSSNRFLKKSR